MGIVTGGLATRQDKLRAEADEAWAALRTAQTELRCFGALHEAEQRSAPDRIEALQALVGAQSQREHALQERYKALIHEREDLRRCMAVPTS